MVRLDKICTINMGQSPDSSTYNAEHNGLPFFQGNADFGEIHPSVRMWCSEPSKIARENDILISVRAPIGALNIANCECCIGRGLAALTVNNDICTREYLWYALSSKIDELNSKGTGSTFKAVNKSTLSETEIPLPPLDEQRRIATTLDKVTNLISKHRRQLDKLDELAKARFVEMFGDPESNDKNWDLVTIGQVLASCEAGWSGNGTQRKRERGEIAVLKVSAVTKGFFIPEECKVLDDQNNIKKYIFPQKGDLIFSRANTREMVGATAVIWKDYPELILPDKLWKLQFCSCAKTLYMKYILSSKTVREKFSTASTGTSGSMYNVSMEKFKAISIPLPPVELQDQFATFIEQIEKARSSISHGLEKLETLKKALMQIYFE